MPTKAAREGKHVALTHCFFCGEGNEIILHRRLGDVSEMHGKVVNMHPCSKCEGYMKQGIILIGIDDAKSGAGWNRPREGVDPDNWMPNPYRTGAFCVIKEEALDRIFNDPGHNAWAKKSRWIFVEHEVLVRLGAIKEPVPV